MAARSPVTSHGESLYRWRVGKVSVCTVWFEAVIGYLSSVVEWGLLHDKPDAWRHWWTNPESETLYCIGKDNIPFHAIIWPAELIGVGESFDAKMGNNQPEPLVLPYDVPANEFMNLEGKKLSGSKNWAVWGLDFLDTYDPDPMRYYLTVNMPETRDSDWDWEEFYQRNNNELVATWGNLAQPGTGLRLQELGGESPRTRVNCGNKTWPCCLQSRKVSPRSLIFWKRSNSAPRLPRRCGWRQRSINTWIRLLPGLRSNRDKTEAAKSVYTAMQAIDWLKLLFSPFLPHTSEKLHQFLGYEKPLYGELITREVADDLSTHTVMLYEPGEALSSENVDLWEPTKLEPGEAFPAAIAFVPEIGSQHR